MEPRERSNDRVGEQIAGRYRLQRLLGAGGMGAVYEALHEFTQRRVAVKLMHASFARSRQAAERFVREARAPSSIGHPGIVEVLDGGYADDGSLYLVLELLEGETLAARMRGGRLLPPELGVIAIELLDALQAAHTAGFVHRDIKPENVFLAGDGDEPSRVTLLDFGIASVLSTADAPGLTQAGAVLGTPLYMSPEQALGRRVDGRSDLWSVGAVCYQALTGRPPFAASNSQALMISIATDEHLPLSVASPDLPLRVVKVIERALHKNPEKRWQSAAEMAEALREAVGNSLRPRDAVSTREVDLQPLARALTHETAVQQARAEARSSTQLWVALAIGCAALAAGFVFVTRAPRSHAATDSAVPPSAATGALVAPPVEPTEEPEAPQPVLTDTPTATDTNTPTSTTTNTNTNTNTNTPTKPEAAPPPEPASPAPALAKTSLDDAQLSAVLRDRQPELQRCYEDVIVAALLQRGTQGTADPAPVRLDAALEINPAGDVRDVKLDGAAPDAMRDCARKAMLSWRFPSSSGPTSLRVPIVFQPNIVK